MKLTSIFFAAAMTLSTLASAAQPLVDSARAFMASYAEDLKQGNRAALGARYHPDGSYVLGNGHKAFETHAATVELYNKRWTRPADFEWQDMSYEQVGDDSVMVYGRFKWLNAPGEKPLLFSYSALLKNVKGQLRIRSEDESTSSK